MFSSNKWNKKEGSPSSFWRKRHLISFNSSVFIENLPSFERSRARARANHAKIDAQKGCAMQLNGITLTKRVLSHARGNAARDVLEDEEFNNSCEGDTTSEGGGTE